MQSPRAPLAYINRAMLTAFLPAHNAVGQAWEIVKLNGIPGSRMAEAIVRGQMGNIVQQKVIHKYIWAK